MATSEVPIREDQFQPASLDLRLGEIAYRVRTSFLPRRGRTVPKILTELSTHTIDLTKGAVLEKGCVYVVPLIESLKLTRDAGFANPKSSTGRLDVFTFDWDFHDNYSIANVLLGSGNGRFSSWETIEFGTDWSGRLGTGDINLDGLTDVAIAAGYDPDTGVPYHTVLFNDGDWPSVLPALPGDYNRNGTVDIGD